MHKTINVKLLIWNNVRHKDEVDIIMDLCAVNVWYEPPQPWFHWAIISKANFACRTKLHTEVLHHYGFDRQNPLMIYLTIWSWIFLYQFLLQHVSFLISNWQNLSKPTNSLNLNKANPFKSNQALFKPNAYKVMQISISAIMEFLLYFGQNQLAFWLSFKLSKIKEIESIVIRYETRI